MKKRFSPPAYVRNKKIARSRVNGKDIYFPGEYDSEESRQAYRELVARLEKEHREKLLGGVSSAILAGECLICELAVEYLKHADRYYAASNEPRHIRRAMRPVLDLYGRLGVDQLTPRKMRDARDAMVAKGWTRQGVNKSVNRTLRMFKWGVAEGYVQVTTLQALKTIDPLKRGRCEAPESPPREAVPDVDVDAIKDHCLPEIWAMVQLQRVSGMRPGEVCGLTMAEINRSDTALWTYSPAKHKTAHLGKSRVVYLGARAIQILQPWLLDEVSEHLFSPRRAMQSKWDRQRAAAKSPQYGKRKARPQGGKLSDKLANAYTSKSYRDAVKRACKAAGVNVWTPYALRHCRARELREKHGLEGVSAILGNSLSAAEIYAARSHELAREIAKKTG